MKTYEFLFILSPQFSDEELPGIIDNVFAEVKKEGGEVKSHKIIGRQTLAYPINNKKHGIYVLAEIEAESLSLSKISRALKLAPEILRLDVSKEVSSIDLSFVKKESSKDKEEKLEQDKKVENVEEEKEENEVKEDSIDEEETENNKEEGVVKEDEEATKEEDSVDEKDEEEKEEEKEKEDIVSSRNEEKIPLDDLDKKLDEILNEEVL